jgi:GWxTD domain-containing protein
LKGRAFAVRSPSFPAVRTPREQAAPLIYLMRRDSLRGTEEMKALLRKATQNEVTLQGHSFSRIKTNTSAYKALMATAKQDSLRVAVRHFWQSHIGDPRKARKVATLYYQRVRAVNELFSNYKEGWKTPRGMTYILFGPPSSVWHYKPPYYESIPGIAKRIAWYYRDSDISPGWLNDTAYPGRNLWGIGFFQPRLQAPSFPFEQFLLNGGCPFCGGVQGITNQVKLMGWLHYKQHQIITWIHHKQQLWLSGNILQEKIYYHRSGTHRVGNY